MKTYSPFKFLLGVLGILNSHEPTHIMNNTCDGQLEVIGAGLSKTGTQSSKFAFESLGYKVYNVESMMYHGHLELVTAIYLSRDEARQTYIEDLNRKILETGATVVLDIPCNFMFRELHALNPQAKVLLSVRDSPDKWLSSIKKTFHAFAPLVSWPYSFFFDLETYSRLMWFEECTHGVDVWQPWFFPWVKIAHRYYMENESLCRSMYDNHNDNVVHHTPPHLLTIYNVKQGWEPLLQMTNLTYMHELPPFPQVNQGSDMDSIAFFTRLLAYIYPVVLLFVGFILFILVYVCITCMILTICVVNALLFSVLR